MDEYTTQLVKESFDLVEPIAPRAAELFYANLFALDPSLQRLGRQHADYGVRDEHYDTVGTALLSTLQQGTGVAFTPEVREAWIEVYGVISRTMKEAARVPA